MVTSLASPPVLPALPPPRATALRPVSASDTGAGAGKRPDIEAEDLREEELRRLQPDGVHARSTHTKSGARDADESSKEEVEDTFTAPQTPSLPGGGAAFLAQLFAQNEPAEDQPDPFGDATRAYRRFREERDAGHFIDIRDPIDVQI